MRHNEFIEMKKILIIQTAFIGDVILATSMLETIRAQSKGEISIDILLRKGNEDLLKQHPYLNQVLIWNKKENKYKNLWALSKQIRQAKYDIVYNLQRFASTGFLTAWSKAKLKVGFKENPFSWMLPPSSGEQTSSRPSRLPPGSEAVWQAEIKLQAGQLWERSSLSMRPQSGRYISPTRWSRARPRPACLHLLLRPSSVHAQHSLLPSSWLRKWRL